MKIFGGLNFAHLRGLGRAKSEDKEARHAEDEDASDDEDMHAAEPEDKGEKDEDAEAGSSKKGGKKNGGKKGKKKPADDEGDDDQEDRDDEDGEDENEDEQEEENGKARKAAAKARRAERARCATIFASPSAAHHVELAAKLAFTTDLSASAARAILETAPVPTKGKSGLGDRMAETKQPNLGPAGPREANKETAIAASWEAAAKDFIPPK